MAISYVRTPSINPAETSINAVYPVKLAQSQHLCLVTLSQFCVSPDQDISNVISGAHKIILKDLEFAVKITWHLWLQIDFEITFVKDLILAFG